MRPRLDLGPPGPGRLPDPPLLLGLRGAAASASDTSETWGVRGTQGPGRPPSPDWYLDAQHAAPYVGWRQLVRSPQQGRTSLPSPGGTGWTHRWTDTRTVRFINGRTGRDTPTLTPTSSLRPGRPRHPAGWSPTQQGPGSCLACQTVGRRAIYLDRCRPAPHFLPSLHFRKCRTLLPPRAPLLPQGVRRRGIYTLESILPLFCDPPHSVGSSPGVVWDLGPPSLPLSCPPLIYVSVYKAEWGPPRWGAEQRPPAPPGCQQGEPAMPCSLPMQPRTTL